MDIKRYLSQASFIDQLLDAVCVVDRKYHIVYVSAACLRIFGYEQDELIGRCIIDLVHPADRERTVHAANDVREGDPLPNFENRYLRKDGSVIHILWSARWSEDYRLHIAVARDITERKLAESRQLALFAISEAAHGAGYLLELFKRVHALIGQWLPAINFSVALCDQPDGLLSFPYRVAEHGDWPLAEVTRLSQEVIYSEQMLLHAEQGSASWLGAPLVAQNGIIGAVLVKSSLGSEPYTEAHKELLQFVSAQIATAIERKKLHAHLQFLAQHDALTGLPNREFLYERLNSALARAKREQQYLAVLHVDLDDFKRINDSYGHGVGDVLLQHVALRLKACVRESDTVARMSGDEFVLVLENLKRPEDGLIVAENIRTELSQPLLIEGQTLNTLPSIGIAVYPEHGDDARQLLHQADTAMYSVKKSSR